MGETEKQTERDRNKVTERTRESVTGKQRNRASRLSSQRDGKKLWDWVLRDSVWS